MWNFKGTLWNSTQNILLIHWKIRFLYNIGILRALRFKSSLVFLKRPPEAATVLTEFARHIPFNSENKHQSKSYWYALQLFLQDVFHVWYLMHKHVILMSYQNRLYMHTYLYTYVYSNMFPTKATLFCKQIRTFCRRVLQANIPASRCLLSYAM